jgi:hypothetical protein
MVALGRDESTSRSGIARTCHPRRVMTALSVQADLIADVSVPPPLTLSRPLGPILRTSGTAKAYGEIGLS